MDGCRPEGGRQRRAPRGQRTLAGPRERRTGPRSRCTHLVISSHWLWGRVPSRGGMILLLESTENPAVAPRPRLWLGVRVRQRAGRWLIARRQRPLCRPGLCQGLHFSQPPQLLTLAFRGGLSPRGLCLWTGGCVTPDAQTGGHVPRRCGERAPLLSSSAPLSPGPTPRFVVSCEPLTGTAHLRTQGIQVLDRPPRPASPHQSAHRWAVTVAPDICVHGRSQPPEWPGPQARGGNGNRPECLWCRHPSSCAYPPLGCPGFGRLSASSLEERPPPSPGRPAGGRRASSLTVCLVHKDCVFS